MSAASNLREYADRLDRFAERCRFKGEVTPTTQAAAYGAASKLRWHRHMVADLRAVDRIVIKAQALVDAVSFDDYGAIVAGQYGGGNGRLLATDTRRAADELRKLLLAFKATPR